MALLDMCRRHGVSMVVAHVNYQKRESAARDMQIVQDYCKQYGIACEVYMQNKQCTYNFQAFARDVRYAFYRSLCEIYHAQGVLLAHQMDDHIETYLMQKETKRLGSYYGIRKEGIVLGVKVYRPLLTKSKKQLEEYCAQHGVEYGIDESNLSDDYARNRMRHHVVDKMTTKEKQTLCDTIEQENKAWYALCLKCQSFLSTWNGSIASLQGLEEEMLMQVLAQFIFEQCAMHVSRKELATLKELIYRHANQWTRDIGSSYLIYSEYGKLCCDVKEDVSYSYTLQAIEELHTPYFHIGKEGKGTEALTLHETDFPITIRSHRQGDRIAMRFGSKRVNRWFIDRKIPQAVRRRYPIVENAQGKVILVPNLGCDITHFSNNPTCFVVK